MTMSAPDPRVAESQAGPQLSRTSKQNGHQPLYAQVAGAIRAAIESGEWPPGFQLPGERAIARSRSVSLMTVRHALTVLQQEGLISRRHGVGTFVSEHASSQPVRLTVPLDGTAAMGTTVVLLDASEVTRPHHLLELMDVPPGGSLTRLLRMRLKDGQPVSLAGSYLPSWLPCELSPADHGAPVLLEVIEARGGFRFVAAEQIIESSVADADVAPVLDVPIGSPLLQVTRIYRLHDGRAGYVVVNRYVSRMYHVRLQVRRTGPATDDWQLDS